MPQPRCPLRRRDYLRSASWQERRARWFLTASEEGNLCCAVCLQPGNSALMELHHLDYRGVRRTGAGWVAREPDEDLLALHSHCHARLHRLIDRDLILRRFRSRRHATLHGIAQLHAADHRQPLSGGNER